MRIIYIGKTIESIEYFKSLVNKTDNYQLVNTYLFTDGYKQVIANDEIDCAVFELNDEDAQDYQMTQYLKSLDVYTVVYGSLKVKEFINFGINANLTHVDFLSNKSNDVKVNAFFASLANNIVEFNVKDFLDPYINDSPITFGDEELEKFIAFLTCRKKKYITSEEIISALYPSYELADKKTLKYRALACMFQSFLTEVGLAQIFNYNDKMCVFNYHLIESDFYRYLEGKNDKFDRTFMDSLNFDFETKIKEEAEDRKIRGELDNVEFFFGDEVYVDFEPETFEEDFNLSVVEEEEVVYEEEFIDKAIRFAKKAGMR